MVGLVMFLGKWGLTIVIKAFGFFWISQCSCFYQFYVLLSVLDFLLLGCNLGLIIIVFGMFRLLRLFHCFGIHC